MGMDLIFHNAAGGPEPDIPRWSEHREFLKAMDAVPCTSILMPCTDGEWAWRPSNIAEAVQVLVRDLHSHRGYLRVMWQLRHDPNLYLAVSY